MGSGAGRVLLLFFCALGNCAGRFGEDSSTLARHLGGVMDEERVGNAVRALGPEKGSAGVVGRVRKVVEQSLFEAGFMKVLEDIGIGVKAGRIPEVKFMVDFLRRLQALEEVPQEEYDSFAAVLWKEFQRLEDEETGNGA